MALTAGMQELGASLRPAAVEPDRRPAPLDRLSWDSLRLLLAIADSGSFRSASVVAGVALNTIRSKVDRLERQFGTALLRRGVEGVTLTQQGHELVSIARQMRELGETTRRVRQPDAGRDANILHIAATEALGTFWLMPRLNDLRSRHPDLRVEITCDMALPDVLFRDVDISVQLSPPVNAELVTEKLATLHVMPFAAARYVAGHGTPASVAEAALHKLVWQRPDQIASEALALLLDANAGGKTAAVQTNTSSAHYWAVARGAGIGLLPSYIATIDPDLIPIDIGIVLRRDVYVVRHRETARAAHVEEALHWLREAFDPVGSPWFADSFVHPRDFDRAQVDAVTTARLDALVDG